MEYYSSYWRNRDDHRPLYWLRPLPYPSPLSCHVRQPRKKSECAAGQVAFLSVIKPGSKDAAISSGKTGSNQCADGWAKDILEQRTRDLVYRPEGP